MSVSIPSATPIEAEQRLRRMLQGRRLIFELGFDEAQFHEYERPLFDAMQRHTIQQLRFQHPALLSTYVALAGTFLYEGGDLYSSLPPKMRDPDVELGRHFVGALRALSLETFEQIRNADPTARRWVTPILAQGGIPRSCIVEFAELVAREIDHGVPDAAEMIGAWRTRGATLSTVHVPTRRFLLYGGDTATDLVQRCVELLRDRARLGHTPTPADVGLPGYVVAGFEQVDRDKPRSRRRAAQQDLGVPKPTLQLDPYDGLGPVIALPTVSGEQLGGIWRVEASGNVHRQPPSAYNRTEIRVPPVSVAAAAFLTADGQARRWTFETLHSQPVLFFDPESRQLLRDTRVLAAGEVWALHSASSSLSVLTDAGDGPPREVQQLPRPTGAWSGFVAHHLDLSGERELRITDVQGQTTGIPVVARRARPQLDGAAVPDVTATGGIPVFDAVPAIIVPGASTGEAFWRIQVHGPGGSASGDLQPNDAGRIVLSVLAASTGFGAYRVRVRGSLGSDVTLRFVVVPGLDVQRPRGVVYPGQDDPTVSVQAADVAFGDLPAGDVFKTCLDDPAATAISVVASQPGTDPLRLRIAVARLVWAIVHDTKPAVEPSSQVLRVEAEEFDDELADLLHVDVGRPGVDVRLRLEDRDGEKVLSSDVVRTAVTGRWSFDLGPFADSIRAQAGQHLSFHLTVGMRSVHVADVVSGVQVTRVSALSSEEGILVAFDQDRPVDSRVVRLWSTARPWLPPLSLAVPNGDTSVLIARDDALPPGQYIAEVAVDDLWGEVRRPALSSPAVQVVHVGLLSEFHEWLAGLDPGDPVNLVTWVMGRHMGTTTFPTERIAEAAPEIAVALQSLVDDIQPGDRARNIFGSLASVATASAEVLVAVVDAIAQLPQEPAQTCRLTMRLVNAVEPDLGVPPASMMSTVWQTAPAIAALIDLPLAADEEIADRCRLHLGWAPTLPPPATAGAQVSQLELTLPVERLRHLRFEIQLRPGAVLDPGTRADVTFDWLIAERTPGRKNDASPQAWYWSYRHLLSLHEIALSPGIGALLREHIDARRAPRGTEEWAGVPAVLLAAMAHILWPSGRRRDAMTALDEATPWGHRSINADAALLVSLPYIHKDMHDRA